jgi:hypothetical protein
MGNNPEDSIPFTRSTDFQGFSEQCSKRITKLSQKIFEDLILPADMMTSEESTFDPIYDTRLENGASLLRLQSKALGPGIAGKTTPSAAAPVERCVTVTRSSVRSAVVTAIGPVTVTRRPW